MIVRFEIMGRAVGKERPRENWHTPARTLSFERDVAWHFKQAVSSLTHDFGKHEGAVEMTLVFLRPVPTGWPQYKRADALAGGLRPCVTPDIDNLEKTILDGLNRVAFKDDKQVVGMTTSKRYSDHWEVAIGINYLELS